MDNYREKFKKIKQEEKRKEEEEEYRDFVEQEKRREQDEISNILCTNNTLKTVLLYIFALIVTMSTLIIIVYITWLDIDYHDGDEDAGCLAVTCWIVIPILMCYFYDYVKSIFLKNYLILVYFNKNQKRSLTKKKKKFTNKT